MLAKRALVRRVLAQTLLPTPKLILETIGFSVLIASVVYILVRYNYAAAVCLYLFLCIRSICARILPAMTKLLQNYNMMGFIWCGGAASLLRICFIVQTIEDNAPCQFAGGLDCTGIKNLATSLINLSSRILISS